VCLVAFAFASLAARNNAYLRYCTIAASIRYESMWRLDRSVIWEMPAQQTKEIPVKPILVTGVGGKVGGIGQKIVQNLLAMKIPVRAMFQTSDAMAIELQEHGAEFVIGDLTNLSDIHRAIEGCERMYFGMGVSSQYLEATVNTVAVAKYHGLKALVNISQMTVSQMSVTETTSSRQQKLHWLSEQVLNWSGLPVVHVRSTVFLENPLFFGLVVESISRMSEIQLPFGESKTSPIAAADVALAITDILVQPEKHIGKVYELTGARSENMIEIAKEYSSALGRPVKYVNLPFEDWKSNVLKPKGLPQHVADHIAAMAQLHHDNRYDRQTGDFQALTGQPPTSVFEWVKNHKGDFVSL
jgi:NAD(P)H dehydrogenase (quinone)